MAAAAGSRRGRVLAFWRLSVTAWEGWARYLALGVIDRLRRPVGEQPGADGHDALAGPQIVELGLDGLVADGVARDLGHDRRLVPLGFEGLLEAEGEAGEDGAHGAAPPPGLDLGRQGGVVRRPLVWDGIDVQLETVHLNALGPVLVHDYTVPLRTALGRRP